MATWLQWKKRCECCPATRYTFLLSASLKTIFQDHKQRSLFQFVQQGCSKIRRFCRRNPSIWIIKKNSKIGLFIRQMTTTNEDFGCEVTPLPLHKWQKYQITMYKSNYLKVTVNGVLMCNTKIGNVTNQYKVTLFAGNDSPDQAKADIRNFEYDSYTAANKVSVLPSGLIQGPAWMPIEGSRMLGIFQHNTYYDLKFEMTIWKQDGYHRSVLRFSRGCDRGPGCRHPAIWMKPDKSLHIRQSSTYSTNSGCDTPPISLHKWSKFQITFNPQNKLEVKVDGSLACNVTIGDVSNQGLLQLWVGGKFYKPALGSIKNLEYKRFPVSIPYPIYPSPSPTKSPLTITPTGIPTPFSSSSPTVSIVPRSIFDSVPFASVEGLVKGASEQAKIELSPMAKSCFSPIVGEDGRGEKSSTRGNNGKAEDTPKVETERELGEVKGGENVDRSKVFMFDDPATDLEFDYFLDPCECFFDAWGMNEPVTEEAFEKVNVESMASSLGFNLLIPEAFKLWEGPHICDLSYLLENTHESGSCAARCTQNDLCKYFAVAETSDGMACIMFSDCDHMLRVDTIFVATMYAHYRLDKGNDLLCHLADPKACWDQTRRRAYLTQKSQPFGTCLWQSLHEQCDFARLIGDTGIQYCAPCTYMKANSQKVKRAMPKAFPHGAKLEAACASEYQIITDKNAGSIVTCIDGEWRDNMGGVGLSNLQCAACVQVFDKVRNGIEMVSASMEELLYINNRHMQMFVFMGSEYPLWIETENYAIQLNAGTSRRYSWAIELDRTTSMILSTRVNHNDTRCLSVNTIQNNLSLQPCQVMHSINDTNTISILPSQVMHALSKKDYKDTGTLQTEETFSCRANNGILTQLGNDNCRPIYIRKTTDRQCIGTTRGFHIKCPKGHAMTNVSQRSALYTAKCAPLPAMGQCTQVEILYSMSNPSSENEIFRGVYYARQYYKHTHQALKCPAHMTIVEFSGERTSNIGSKLKLKCCFVPFYSGVKLADDPMQGFKSYEGLYCPTRYDDLLRLKFRQASSYGLSNLHSLVETAESVQIESYSKDVRLFESALEGKKKHYHTPPPTRHPTRYPSRFPTKQPTGFPTPSPTGFPTPYPKPNATRDHRGYISYRKTTNQWCLSYGPGTETCSRAHELDHPLLVDWIAEVKAGVRFSVTPVSLLQGEGMTASVGVPKAGAIDVPEKPQLIKFRSEEPEYDQGCIDIRSGKFSEAQQVFASTSSCGIVSSMTWNKDGDSNQQEGPGITNERMNDCFGREISRSWKEMTWEYGFNAASLTHRVFKSVIDYGCSQLPKPEFGVGGGLIPVYFGIKIPLPEICEYVSGAASDIAQYEREQKMRVKTRQLAKERYTDCNPTRIGIMRLLCDMHCLDDTVKSGAKAVLRQVKASNENILTNIDALMSYYAQLEMQKMTSEVNKLKSAQASSNQVNGLNPPGSVSSMTSRSMLLRLRDQMISNMEKYFDLGKEITQPKNGRLSHEALMGIVKANTEAQVALNNTLELLPTAQDSKTFVRKALEQIDARLTRGYKEALRVQRASAGRVDNFGRNMVAKRTARISVNLNISAALKSHLYDVKSAALALFHTRTKNIVNTVLELPTSTMHSSTGVIAWKIDQISNDVNFFRQEIEIHDLQETIGSLALQWGTVHAHVVEYLADAKRLTAMTQSILSEIQSYTTCGRDSSFIRRATYDFNQIHERAAKTLKNAWPEVVRAAVAHMQTYAIENVPRRSIHASFASLRIPATQFASEYLTVSGVQKARALLEKQLDGLPFDMTHQAVALLTQVSFLRSSMITTDFNPTQHEIEQATAAYRTLSAITQTQIGALANNRHVLALFSQVLDAQLVTVAPAPGSCRQIAFDRFNDPQAASFVTLSSFNTANLSPNVTSAFVVSPPLSRLLSVFDIDQEIEISKAFSFENHAAASLLLRSVHVCAREQSLSPPGTRWTLQRAIDMPQGAGVKFCTGKACIGAAKGAIHVATRDEAEKAVDLTGTALLKLVRTAFY
ncbi:hypothetical protein AAMO2058_001673300 [Amorphochlora amoebiformis]|uniref:Uncharacterized protein n=1 Tax=Amorphochlora amoebiformis TaxID=1561963 RepID=A0A7S0DMY5_9EUKA|mmetsp:Transcript_31480/g.50556  ORF Transcript_31480/g.50556 Transcript_31480/m.50556 type:complete len:1998 (+) Transcript_31480:2155-8148(+)